MGRRELVGGELGAARRGAALGGAKPARMAGHGGVGSTLRGWCRLREEEGEKKKNTYTWTFRYFTVLIRGSVLRQQFSDP
jgi:hypothetical protein